MRDETRGSAPGATDFLAGGGEMALLIGSADWSNTPLGPIESWPQSLKTTVSLCLASNFPINIIWGPEHCQIYNDGYRAVCGDAHPSALGEAYTRTWASAWPAIGQPFDRALAGETSYLENQRMFLFRNGYLEETFFTFSISPIRDESGGIGGLFHPVTETTPDMLAERRTRLLHDLNAGLGAARTTGEVYARAIEMFADHAFDLPFVLIYDLTDTERAPRLAGFTGVGGGMDGGPGAPFEPGGPWVGALARLTRPGELTEIPWDGAPAACGPYDEPPSRALAFPIRAPGVEAPTGLLLAGASPRLPLNDAYRDFFGLVVSAVAAGAANAKTCEAAQARIDGAARLSRLRREAAERERRLGAQIAEEKGKAALRQSELRLELALQAGRMGGWEQDLVDGEFTPSGYLLTMLGVADHEPFTTQHHLAARVHPEDRRRRREEIARAVAGGGDLEVEYRVQGPDGQVRWILERGRATYENGTPTRMAGVSLDITERKDAESHLRLLLDELNHRVKNTLATVQSIATQTLRHTPEPAAFSSAFLERIYALARAHEMLTDAAWHGASLADVIDRTLAAHTLNDEPGRVALMGPAVKLGPTAAVTLNMAFHELATNAAKYGALSRPGGRIDVDWGMDEPGAIVINWRESGGPPVTVPSRRGFGLRLIEQGLTRELGGEAHITFLPDGLWCRLRLPLSSKLSLAA